MSADSWSVCPRCAARDPFMDHGDEEQWTMREDYEFYMTPAGEFTADYHGKCSTCKFDFSFHYKQQVPVQL